MKNYGEILKEHRVIRNLTLKEIENKTGINNGSLSRWERNEVLPSIDACIRLADFYGISVDELLGISNDDFHIRTATPMGDGLSSEERKLLSVYQSLSPDMRETLWSLLATWTPDAQFKSVKN